MATILKSHKVARIDTTIPNVAATTDTLNMGGGLSSGGTSVTLTGVAGATNTVNGTYMSIAGDVMLIISGGATLTLTVQRTASATSHSNGATVNLAGSTTVYLPQIATVPNQPFVIKKVTTDINYAIVTCFAGDSFPPIPGVVSPPSTILLSDASANLGTIAFVAPKVGTQWIQQFGAGAAGPPGSGASPTALGITYSGPAGELGVLFNGSFVATGGVLPYTFAVISGSLPVGLSLNTATGNVSGTPITTGAFGFTVRVTDAASTTTSKAVTITVYPTGGTPVAAYVSSVSLSLFLEYMDLSTQLTHRVYNITPTWNTITGLQQMTIWIKQRRDTGGTVGWYWWGVPQVAVPGGVAQIDIIIPAGASFNLQVAVLAGFNGGDSVTQLGTGSLPTGFSGAIPSGTIATVLTPPGANDISVSVKNLQGVTPTQGNIQVMVDAIQVPYWALQIQVTTPGNTDPDLWYTQGWIQWTDVVGNPLDPSGGNGIVLSAAVTGSGSGYTNGTYTLYSNGPNAASDQLYSPNVAGQNAVIQVVIVSNAATSVTVLAGGNNWNSGSVPIPFTSGGGTGLTLTLTCGPAATGWQAGDQFVNDGTVQQWKSGGILGLVGGYPAPGVDGYLTIQFYAFNRNSTWVNPSSSDANTILQNAFSGASFFRMHIGRPRATVGGFNSFPTLGGVPNITNAETTANPNGLPIVANVNSAVSLVPDWNFNLSVLGALGASANSPWSGNAVFIKNDGLSSTNGVANYAELTPRTTNGIAGVTQTVPVPEGQLLYFQFSARSNNPTLSVVGFITAGSGGGTPSGYTNGTYSIPLNGAGGTSATASVTIVSNVITASSLTAQGSGYTPNAQFTINITAGGGTGLVVNCWTGSNTLNMYITAYDEQFNIVIVNGNVTNAFSVTGPVASWANNAASGYLLMPSDVAVLYVQFQVSLGEVGIWDLTNVVIQPGINQTGNGQSLTTDLNPQTFAYSAVNEVAVSTTASSSYGLGEAEIIASDGARVGISAYAGTAAAINMESSGSPPHTGLLQADSGSMLFSGTSANDQNTWGALIADTGVTMNLWSGPLSTTGPNFGVILRTTASAILNSTIVAGVSHDCVDGETVTTSGGTRHVRGGFITYT